MTVTKDKSAIDRSAVVKYLTEESYWARERPEEKIRRSLENSLCFSLLEGEEFIGFCRVITDRTTFSYLCDLFILTPWQNRGYGSSFLKAIMEDEELEGTKFVLFTKTAHKFYERHGFHQREEWLEKVMFK